MTTLPEPSGPESRFRLLQKWNGIVDEVDLAKGEFAATIRDLTDPTRGDEVVCLSLDEISIPERPLLVEGAVFYWSVGYKDFSDGRRERVSSIRLQRLPAWTCAEIERAENEASRVADELDWNWGEDSPQKTGNDVISFAKRMDAIDAAEGLADSTEARRVLLPFLQDGTAVCRESAIYALRNHINVTVREALREMSECDPSPGVRQAASDMLAQE
jgi:hypothetical protein